MSQPTEERIISPDDEDWDWRAGHKILHELGTRCRILAERDGAHIHRDYYRFELHIEGIRIRVGEDNRVAIDAGFGTDERRCIYASHAQVGPRWEEIQTKTLPLLRSLMVLDDLADIPL